MRGIGTTFSLFPKVAAWLAGAAILAGTFSPRAFAQSDEVAMAVPRLAANGRAALDGDLVALPRPLAASDAALFRQLFRLARGGTCTAFGAVADRIDRTVRLNDEILGHVLADRYLGCGRRTVVADLAAWLARYPTLPDAPAIAEMLRSRDRSAAIPSNVARMTQVISRSVRTPDPSPHLFGADSLAQKVHARLRQGAFASAERLVTAARGVRSDDVGTLLAEVAQACFTHNRDADALRLADRARLLAPHLGFPPFVAGLAAWRLGRTTEALTRFAESASAQQATPDVKSAAAYWAAKASLATGDQTSWRGWLTYAAADQRSFYGLIAGRMLGWANRLDFTREVLGEADVDAVAAEPGGLRAFALLQVGQDARAAAEFRRLAASKPGITRSVMLVAEHAGMFSLAAGLADDIAERGDYAPEYDRFPVPELHPREGFLMDPALVYALTRVESNFDAGAVSPEGAEGLMQVMPQTASAMRNSAGLRNPAVNLDIGQRYLAQLAAEAPAHGDLIRLLASYNDGPAKCAAWCDTVRDYDDPILFIEAIPVEETREFVRRILTDTWIYAARLHLASPSLDAIVAGHFPRFSDPSHAPTATMVLN
jgi:soluble lytic murein transglycosylase-like protein